MEVDDVVQIVEEGKNIKEKKKQFIPFNLDAFSFLNSPKRDEIYYLSNLEYGRQMKCIVGFLEAPHGSVKLLQGETCVLCSVYGPSDIRMHKEQPHRGAVDVVFRPKTSGMSRLSSLAASDLNLYERELETVICEIFETSLYLEDYPGYGFNLVLNEMEDDGALLATLINGTALALINAGCSIRFAVAAVTVVITHENKLIIDPSKTQIGKSFKAMATFAFNNANELLYSKCTGEFTFPQYKACYVYALKSVHEIFKFWKRIQDSETSTFINSSVFGIGALNLKDSQSSESNTKQESDVPDDQSSNGDSSGLDEV